MVPSLRELRTVAGMSQAQLAERIGVDRATVSRWEHPDSWGVRPNQMVRLALAQVFGVDPEAVTFGGEANRKRGYPEGRPRKPAPPDVTREQDA